MMWSENMFKYKYKRMPKQIKEYLIELLGKEQYKEIMYAIKTHSWIVISGPECSGKTILWTVLREIGYPYVLEEHMTVQIKTTKQFTDPVPSRYIYEPLGIDLTH